MFPNYHYDYFQSHQPVEDVNSSYGLLNNSSNIGYNSEAYYNNYWYSRSDCSSSSVDTSESTSPSSSRQQSYNIYNSYYSTPSCFIEPTTPPQTVFKTHDFITTATSTDANDEFSKEILPLLNIMNGAASNGLKRRMRTAFTDEQRLYLLKIFEKTVYPSKETLEELSKKMNVTCTIIQTWFKNMRAKKKKVSKAIN